MWPTTRIHEPPSRHGHSGKSNVSTDEKVAEEQPPGDEGVLDMARGLVYDVDVRRVEVEGCSWETVGDQVHPEQLYGNESLRETKGGCQEDAVR